MRRVNESLRKVLADGVERLGDPSVGFVTVTGVRATTDFSQAIVYVSVLGREKRRTRSLRALERAHGVLLASHENPDGDAIGSMSAAALALRAAGKQVRLYLHPDSPLPHEYGFLNMDGLERSIEPGSTEGWTLLALDCGNESRLGPDHERLRAGFAQVIDVDHHHDNSRFGDVNYVDGHASSTAEILAR